MGGARSIPSAASSLAWLGSSIGGIIMGQIADRVGVRWTIMFGATSIAIGLVISAQGEPWHLYVGHGVFMGLLGNAGINAPLYVYVSRWFDRHRGSALALLSSGSYLAGTLWPTIFERAIANYGWQITMIAYAAFEIAFVVPVAFIFLRSAPEVVVPAGAGGGSGAAPRVFGWPPNLVFVLLSLAGFFCCVTMSMPQAHLVALCTDLGISASTGAAMLSVLLGFGVVTRQLWGFVSDRIGGLFTILISSAFQATAMVGFTVTQDETGLFAVAGVFGAGFSALIPAYVLTIRELFPAREASWRVPTLLMVTGLGMGTGSWLAGVVYDHAGYYAPAFAVGVVANVLNFILIAVLVTRQQRGRTAPPSVAAA
jgi:MFS family permease